VGLRIWQAAGKRRNIFSQGQGRKASESFSGGLLKNSHRSRGFFSRLQPVGMKFPWDRATLWAFARLGARGTPWRATAQPAVKPVMDCSLEKAFLRPMLPTHPRCAPAPSSLKDVLTRMRSSPSCTHPRPGHLVAVHFFFTC
jgi:hypothetical protein